MTTEYKLTPDESYEMGQNCRLSGLNEGANPLRNYPASEYNSKCSDAWLKGFADAELQVKSTEAV